MFVTLPYGVSGRVKYIIVSIPDLCLHLYFVLEDDTSISKGYFMRSKHPFVLIHIRIKGEVGIVKHV